MGLSIEQQREKIRERNAAQKKSDEANRKRDMAEVHKVKDVFVKGIYFLYFKNKIVYIGMSASNVMERISSHYKDSDKRFDSFSFKEKNMSTTKLLKHEKTLIRKYKPKYNTIHKNTGRRAKVIYGHNTK